MELKSLSTATIILRGFDTDEVESVVESMVESPIKNIEVTSNSPNYIKTIEYISQNYPNINVGAGTIIRYEQAEESIKAGASFLLSPTKLNPDVIKLCKDNDVISVPSGMTPSEIYEMFEYGADIVKVFPATTIGPKFFKDIQAPLGDLNLMAVGGININNAKDFLDNKCKYLGIGSGMFRKKDIEDKNIQNLKKSIQEFSKIMED